MDAPNLILVAIAAALWATALLSAHAEANRR